MTNIRISNLVKKYGESNAVNNVDIDIKNSELFILLGPSGCGKTTTLLCIAGLIKPEEGEIWFDEQIVTSAEKNYYERPQDRNVAMVFQDYAIYPHMTVFKNIAFPLEIKNMDKKEIEKLVHSTAKSLGIEELLDRKPKQLSGGQRQRVALARAIVREPNAFLMDEPLSNLDAKLRIFARAELKKLHRRLGITTIYVTHDQIEAMSLGDRIAILNKGEIEQIDKPQTIFDLPKNLFVAGFIGSPPMNLIDGSVKEENGTVYFTTKKINYKVPSEFSIVKELKGKEIVLGIRPEDIKLSKNESDNSIKATIEIIELTGREFEVHLKVEEERIIALIRNIENFKINDVVNLIFDEEKLHFFNKETGENTYYESRK
ncbi:MAG: ABC transporter ATP-binding protein [Candidatus Lokiarchaeota archaeon]|nr:ABC transporter ATP-binding protein [Candidatus Lokiarchaeota archaeon]